MKPFSGYYKGVKRNKEKRMAIFMLRVIPKNVVVAYLNNLLANARHDHRIIDMLNVVENSHQYYWKRAWHGLKPGYLFIPVVHKSKRVI